MGTVFSFDVRGGDPRAVEAALASAVAGLHKVNEVFSTYRENSQISRLARGEISVAECDPEVTEVLDLCAEAERLSEGWFSHTYQGQIDPTGLVKGWAAERAARTMMAAGATGVSVNGGGDVQLCGAPGPQRPWRVGVRTPSARAAWQRWSRQPAPTNWRWPPRAQRNAARTSSTRAQADQRSRTWSR